MGFEQPSHVPSISAELLLGEEGSRLEAGHGVGVGGQRPSRIRVQSLVTRDRRHEQEVGVTQPCPTSQGNMVSPMGEGQVCENPSSTRV